jgi:hypothetical protein
MKGSRAALVEVLLDVAVTDARHAPHEMRAAVAAAAEVDVEHGRFRSDFGWIDMTHEKAHEAIPDRVATACRSCCCWYHASLPSLGVGNTLASNASQMASGNVAAHRVSLPIDTNHSPILRVIVTMPPTLSSASNAAATSVE